MATDNFATLNADNFNELENFISQSNALINKNIKIYNNIVNSNINVARTENNDVDFTDNFILSSQAEKKIYAYRLQDCKYEFYKNEFGYNSNKDVFRLLRLPEEKIYLFSLNDLSLGSEEKENYLNRISAIQLQLSEIEIRVSVATEDGASCDIASGESYGALSGNVYANDQEMLDIDKMNFVLTDAYDTSPRTFQDISVYNLDTPITLKSHGYLSRTIESNQYRSMNPFLVIPAASEEQVFDTVNFYLKDIKIQIPGYFKDTDKKDYYIIIEIGGYRNTKKIGDGTYYKRNYGLASKERLINIDSVNYKPVYANWINKNDRSQSLMPTPILKSDINTMLSTVNYNQVALNALIKSTNSTSSLLKIRDSRGDFVSYYYQDLGGLPDVAEVEGEAFNVLEDGMLQQKLLQSLSARASDIFNKSSQVNAKISPILESAQMWTRDVNGKTILQSEKQLLKDGTYTSSMLIPIEEILDFEKIVDTPNAFIFSSVKKPAEVKPSYWTISLSGEAIENGFICKNTPKYFYNLTPLFNISEDSSKRYCSLFTLTNTLSYIAKTVSPKDDYFSNIIDKPIEIVGAPACKISIEKDAFALIKYSALGIKTDKHYAVTNDNSTLYLNQQRGTLNQQISFNNQGSEKKFTLENGEEYYSFKGEALETIRQKINIHPLYNSIRVPFSNFSSDLQFSAKSITFPGNVDIGIIETQEHSLSGDLKTIIKNAFKERIRGLFNNVYILLSFTYSKSSSDYYYLPKYKINLESEGE